ncbi:hypothetical protein ACHAXN_011936 [Cyclotella atomus]
MPAASHYLRIKAAAKTKAAMVKAKSIGLKDGSLRKESTIDDCTECGDAPNASLSNLFNSFHHSYLLHLKPETKHNMARSLRKRMELRHEHPGRPVYNGHYVRVSPEPLKNPKLVLVSEDACSMLGLDSEDVTSEEFIKYFSGDVKGALAQYQDVDIETWATPYALSIMGKRYVQDKLFGGDGYGDGRAISRTTVDPDAEGAVEAVKQYYPEQARRYELQLKGAGPTPFCRAMHYLGVGTTRALCLIASEGESKKVFFGLKKKKKEGDMSLRPWYSDKDKATAKTISVEDPRLAGYSEADRREIVNQYAIRAKSEPETMIEEKCAVTTRVCSSFIRVGHLDLFARRVVNLIRGGEDEISSDVDYSLVKKTDEYIELEDMMWHACYREFYAEGYSPFIEKKDAKGAALAMLDSSMIKLAEMVANWVRVGFVQGNFNADNCLVSGNTMDYGPFGFIDVYHPLASKWTAPKNEESYGFINQTKAGYANFTTLLESVLPIVEVCGGNVDEIRQSILAKAENVFAEALAKAIRSKMGLELGPSEMAKQADALWKDIEPLLRIARADWTLFWRQLTYVALNFSPSNSETGSTPDTEKMMEVLLGTNSTNPFYDPLTPEHRTTLKSWLSNWHKALVICHEYYLSQRTFAPPCERMQRANPKYTLREWMLVESYSTASGSKYSQGDYSLVQELHQLTKDPYSEGSPENHAKYYRRAPDESLRTGGTAFMS